MKLRISPALNDWFISRFVFLGFALIITGFFIAYITVAGLEEELALYKKMLSQSEKEKWSLLMLHNKQYKALQEQPQSRGSER